MGQRRYSICTKIYGVQSNKMTRLRELLIGIIPGQEAGRSMEVKQIASRTDGNHRSLATNLIPTVNYSLPLTSPGQTRHVATR